MRRVVLCKGSLHVLYLLLPALCFAEADIALTAAVARSPIVVNGTAYLQAAVSNFGTDPAQDVAVTTTLPSGLNLVIASTTQGACTGISTIVCDVGTIVQGNQGVQATISLEVTAGLASNVNTTFTATSSTSDSNTANNNATATLEVVTLADSADLSIGYDVMPVWAYEGSELAFPLVVVNNGPAAAGTVKLDFSVPDLSLVSFSSATPSQGSCRTGLTDCIGLACVSALELPLRVTCNLGPLSPGAVASAEIVVAAAGALGDVFENRIGVQSDQTADPNDINNSGSTLIELISAPTIEAGSGPGGCFIATAAYGSSMEKEVEILRQFRDEHLLRYALGRRLVSTYYQYSPPIARYITEHHSMRFLVRGVLWIPVTLLRFPLTALLATACMATIALSGIYYRCQRTRSVTARDKSRA